MQQGRKHGLRDARDLARYASLWCIWGPSFDGKPSFAWAAEILGDSRRGAALKLHQLAHRTRQELQQRQAAEGGAAAAGAAPVLTTAQFESALAGVDARDRPCWRRRARCSRRASRRAVALKACDLGVIDMMVAEAENLQEYRHYAERLAAVRGRQDRRRRGQVDARAGRAGGAGGREPCACGAARRHA